VHTGFHRIRDGCRPAAFVPTHQFLYPESESPAGGLHHWHGNAESYLRIGKAMGEALVELLPQ